MCALSAREWGVYVCLYAKWQRTLTQTWYTSQNNDDWDSSSPSWSRSSLQTGLWLPMRTWWIREWNLGRQHGKAWWAWGSAWIMLWLFQWSLKVFKNTEIKFRLNEELNETTVDSWKTKTIWGQRTSAEEVQNERTSAVCHRLLHNIELKQIQT